MSKRFSLGRVFAEAGGLIAKRWPMLLVSTIALGVILLFVNLAINEFGLNIQGDRTHVFATLVPSLIRTVTDSLILGLMLGALLAPGDIGTPTGRLAPFRAAILRFPAVLLSQALYILPVLIMIVVTGVMINSVLTSTGDLDGMVLKVMLLTNVGWLAALMILALVGMAAPAAVAEGLGPRAALSRSVALTRGRGPLLFGLYLGIVGATTGAVLLAAFHRPAALQTLPSWIGLIVAPLFAAVKALAFAALYLELARLATPDGVIEGAEA